MRQYTTPEQTAKLIELGFEKPKMAAPALKWVDGEPTFEPQYTIGELLSILPLTVGKNYDLHIEFLVTEWYVAYYWIGNGEEYYIKYDSSACELIDALYMMILSTNSPSKMH